jgi:dTDP-4-dehydrorhamnose reductase
VKVVITGANGQVGRELQEAFPAANADTELVCVDLPAVDIGDRDEVLALVTGTAPDLIVNAAAYTAVDAAESDVDAAWRTNALAVRHLAEAADRVGAHLVHISTDYVFDGTKDTPYVEWDTPSPASVYGATKLGGEIEAMHARSVTVARTSWVCSRHGSNMVKTILRVAQTNPELAFVDDQVGHPTFADDLARMLVRLGTERRPGLFHVTNSGATSWYGFARAVLEAAGEDPDRVRPIATADLQPPRPAARPANSVLDNAALRLSGIDAMPAFTESLERTVRWLADHGD